MHQNPHFKTKIITFHRAVDTNFTVVKFHHNLKYGMRNNMHSTTLCFALTFTLLCASAYANSSDENKYICLDPTQYQGSKTVACACGQPDNTCDYFINHLQTGSNDLASITFDANFDATTASTDAKSLIELLGGQLECCSDGKSALYKDRSNVCADPSTFLPRNNFKSEDGGFDGRCDLAVHSINDDNMGSCYGEDFSQTWSCSGKSSSCQVQLLELARGGCCGVNGKSACWRDFSHACLDPADYDGSIQYTFTDEDDGSTYTSTCDAVITYNVAPDKPLRDEDFSQAWSCDGKSSAVTDLVQGFTNLGCCGVNGKSACWQEPQDFSGVCLDPANYDGSKQYTSTDEDDGSTHTSTCDAVMTSLTTSSESPLAGEDFSQSWSCEGKSSAVTNLVQGITNIGCCGTISKSACWSEPTQANLCDGARIFFECDAIGSKSECIAVSSCQMGC